MRFLAALLLLSNTLAAAELPAVPLPSHGAVLRIAVTGDTGEGAETVAAAIAALHRQSPVDAIVLAGDTFYPCGVTSVDDPRWRLVTPLTRIGVPVFPVLGNHDFCGKSDPDAQIRASAAIRNWHFPARQYAVRAKLADFAFLDTTPFATARRHGNELEPALREAFREAKAPWRIAVGHHPLVSSGYHGYFPRDQVLRMRTLAPQMHDEQVDLYICGHDHHLELVRGQTMMLVSGAGSSPIPPIRLHRTTIYPAEISRERIGFAVVELSARTMRVRFYDGRGRSKSEWVTIREKK
ncbi:MAG TPA: metallophosphoesterase [Thermoanaerobaculia bacterium]|jgi:acid phosphatase